MSYYGGYYGYNGVGCAYRGCGYGGCGYGGLGYGCGYGCGYGGLGCGYGYGCGVYGYGGNRPSYCRRDCWYGCY